MAGPWVCQGASLLFCSVLARVLGWGLIRFPAADRPAGVSYLWWMSVLLLPCSLLRACASGRLTGRSPQPVRGGPGRRGCPSNWITRAGVATARWFFGLAIAFGVVLSLLAHDAIVALAPARPPDTKPDPFVHSIRLPGSKATVILDRTRSFAAFDAGDGWANRMAVCRDLPV